LNKKATRNHFKIYDVGNGSKCTSAFHAYRVLEQWYNVLTAN
jgi:hypothetical protein